MVKKITNDRLGPYRIGRLVRIHDLLSMQFLKDRQPVILIMLGKCMHGEAKMTAASLAVNLTERIVLPKYL